MSPSTRAVSVEALLRRTLRALAVCSWAASERQSIDELLERANTLASELAQIVDELDDREPSEAARCAAASLAAQLATLERLIDAERQADRQLVH
jgi:hypothetical protein